jgi:ribosomal protein L37AE/L43A
MMCRFVESDAIGNSLPECSDLSRLLVSHCAGGASNALRAVLTISNWITSEGGPAVQSNGHPIETFDPLLRDLIAWGLVTRTGEGRGSWKLAESAERRLSELAGAKGVVDAESVLYFNHRCAACRAHGPTRLRDGLYICGNCSVRVASETPELSTVVTSEPRSRRYPKLHANRDKGSLAS